MGYLKRATVTRRPRRRGLMGLGGFSDSDQCSTIPMGDPYRKPDNYCATPDGGLVTFNADGSVVRTPGGVDPDPAHPAGTRASGGSWFDSLFRAFTPTIASPPFMPPVQSSGISTTTVLALAGGAVVLAYLVTRR